MKLFRSARLTLTLWYLLISMVISIAFSIAIYVGASREFNRILRTDEYRREHPQYKLQIEGATARIEELKPERSPDPVVISDARLRVLEGLIGANVLILLLSAASGYFLAGRTLKPIQQMVHDQNRFISDASHELNTPLTALRTEIEVNLRNKTLSVEKAKNILTSNLEEVEHLQALSSSLMELTRYESTTHAKEEKVSLKKITQKAIETIIPLAKKKQITLNQNIDDLFVKGQERSLTEVIVILLDNAIKYSQQKTHVGLNAKYDDGKVQIQVTDEGIGIAENDLVHIFDRFYRADISRTKSTPGFGLGLSIAQSIITTYKGTISAESTIGKGTTFTILLPSA